MSPRRVNRALGDYGGIRPQIDKRDYVRALTLSRFKRCHSSKDCRETRLTPPPALHRDSAFLSLRLLFPRS